jgi:hypothetical protein
MKKHIFLFFSIFLVCALTSCTRAFVLEVFNDTGMELELVSADTAHNEKHYTIEPNKSERIQIPSVLTVKHGSGVWTYILRPLPTRQAQGYMTSEHLGPLIEKFQIEPDGSIYILLGDTKAIVKAFPPQPSGYPVKPRT